MDMITLVICSKFGGKVQNCFTDKMEAENTKVSPGPGTVCIICFEICCETSTRVKIRLLILWLHLVLKKDSPVICVFVVASTFIWKDPSICVDTYDGIHLFIHLLMHSFQALELRSVRDFTKEWLYSKMT